jgi:hypothetical protein
MAKNKNEVKIVSLTGFLFGNIAWAKENEDYKDFYYYDPELFYESLAHLENSYRTFSGMKIKNPIRSKGYDDTQLKTKEISENWFNQLIEKNKLVKMDKIYSTTGLVIDY